MSGGLLPGGIGGSAPSRSVRSEEEGTIEQRQSKALGDRARDQNRVLNRERLFGMLSQISPIEYI